MKSNRRKLKYIIIILILIQTAILPIMLNLMNNNSREKTPISTIKIPKLSATTEWVPNGTLICNADATQAFPQICSDGSGGAIIAWLDLRNSGAYDIYAQRIDANGNLLWTPNGTVISTLDGGALVDINICSDEFGGAIIVWAKYIDLVMEYNVYTQRVDTNGIPQWAPNGTAICTENNHQLDVKVCSDGMGGGIISWEDLRSETDYDIYAQKINVTGDIKWTPNGTAICTKGLDQRTNQIISDGEGGAIITWKDNRDGNLDIYAQKINANGLIQWDANGTVICSDSNDQDNPQLCSDGNGGAIITWEDYRDGYADIFAQKINSNGVVQWTPNGVVVCMGPTFHDLVTPQICSDGVNGSIITWVDKPGGGAVYWDIYAQRVNISGIPQWISNGITVCGVYGRQEKPLICSDGSGGAFITWEDNRKGNLDIYAQKIDSNGNNNTNNRAICNLDSQAGDPQLCSDGFGSAIITWEDSRIPNADIYCLRIDDIPYSNHPEDFNTYLDGSEIINWTLFDDTTGGKYRVLADDTNGNFYVWVNWTVWNHNVPLNIPINRTELGTFNYRIEYYDELNQFGIPDTIIVSIKSHPAAANIPFGHYYLLFIILGVVFLTLIKKSLFHEES